MSDDLGIPLSQMIKELRAELDKTVKEGDGESLRLRVDGIELDLQVAVTQEVGGTTGGEAGVKFWVFNAKASAEVSGKWERSRTQNVKLKLMPVQFDEEGEATEDEVLLSADS